MYQQNINTHTRFTVLIKHKVTHTYDILQFNCQLVKYEISIETMNMTVEFNTEQLFPASCSVKTTNTDANTYISVIGRLIQTVTCVTSEINPILRIEL